MKFTFTTYLERGDDELEVQVIYSVTPFVPATYWQPAEGGEIEIIEALLVTNTNSPLTEDELEKLTLEAKARSYEDQIAEIDNHADYLYEQYRDRKMEEL